MDLLAIASGVAQRRLRARRRRKAPSRGSRSTCSGSSSRRSTSSSSPCCCTGSSALPLTRMLEERRARIEQGLSDAEQARKDREAAEAERLADAPGGAPRGERDPRPRPEGRPGDPRRATSPRPRRSSSGCASGRPPRSRPRSSGRWPSSAAEVADLALAAAGRVVGETMTDRPRAPARRGVPRRDGRPPRGGSSELMARRDTAPRRYAEAAFEIAAPRRDRSRLARELDAAAADGRRGSS